MEPSQPQLPQISPSRINTFFDCPKQHHYKYTRELVSKSRESARKFDKGNYFHELLHVYYQNVQAGATPGSLYLQETLKNRILQDLQKLSSPSSELMSVYANVSTRMLRYIRQQSPKIDAGMKVLAVEAEMSFATDVFEFFGYTDLIFEKADRTVIRDHKSGERAWSKVDVRFHNQNFYYALTYFLATSVVAEAEISFLNTKEYASKEPPVMFEVTPYKYSQKELEIYYEQICGVVDKMLNSDPIPFYGKHCSWCPYQTPCFMERKGIDSSEVIEVHFTKRDKRHGRFTEENTVNDDTDQKSTGLSIQW